MDTIGWIPPDEWKTIVRNVPIVSVDLIVRIEGGILLGKRTNEPAKGEWFIPGGRVRKGERLTEAVYRVAADEIGVDVDIVHTLGAFDHFYETSDVGENVSKHYVACGYVVEPHEDTFQPDAQHDKLQLFRSPPDDLHTYPRRYLEATPGLDWW